MRQAIQEQMKFGEVTISDIEFDIRSRDEIPKLLLGLQEVYCDLTARRQVFEALVSLVPKGINPHKGRRGMDLWKILVLGVLRLNCLPCSLPVDSIPIHFKIFVLACTGVLAYDHSKQFRLMCMQE